MARTSARKKGFVKLADLLHLKRPTCEISARAGIIKFFEAVHWNYLVAFGFLKSCLGDLPEVDCSC